MEIVVEPPELYGPHVPVIVFQTFDCCTREPDNSDGLSGVLGKPKSYTLPFRAGFITGGITVLQQFVQIYYIGINSGSLTTISLQTIYLVIINQKF